ncbi:MAG: hypothetical protein U5L96_16015 [Owenweeksia sp.]|nr:hypothetical protein [Owenweeksia sp.]
MFRSRTWLDDQLKEELHNESFQSDREGPIWRNIFYWLLYEFDPSQFDLKKQWVKYGAPGTGKTYGSKRQVANHFNLWKARYPGYNKEFADQLETVQFHPSYTYEDFLEGIRPVLKEGKTELKLTNGIFKRLCKKAADWEMDVYQQIPELTFPSQSRRRHWSSGLNCR